MTKPPVMTGADFVVLTHVLRHRRSPSSVARREPDRAIGSSRLRFLSHIAEQVTFVMVPPLFLIFLVLGTIFIGVATPTEGGAMGATGALVLALMKRRLNFDLVAPGGRSRRRSCRPSSMFILIGARVFSLTFYGVDGHLWVEHLLVSLPGGQIGFLIFVNVLVFVLAFFLDFFELAFIVVPLLGPAAEKLGIDLIWFGVMLGVNMQTSFMHPPFGFALFYLRSVAPAEPYIDRVTGKRMDAGHDRADLLGRGAVRGHPVHHGRAGHPVPADGHALQGNRRRRSIRARSNDPRLPSRRELDVPPLDLRIARAIRLRRGRSVTAARAGADQVGVVGILRDLPPQILLVAERRASPPTIFLNSALAAEVSR